MKNIRGNQFWCVMFTYFFLCVCSFTISWRCHLYSLTGKLCELCVSIESIVLDFFLRAREKYFIYFFLAQQFHVVILFYGCRNKEYMCLSDLFTLFLQLIDCWMIGEKKIALFSNQSSWTIQTVRFSEVT